MVVYALAWALLLVNRGLYWDDYVLAGQPPGELVRMFTELGLPWGSIAYIAIFATPFPGWLAHVLAFGAYLAATLLFHAILRRAPGLTPTDALVGGLVFAVLPVNVARIAVIDLMYGLSLLAFLAATWLLLEHIERPRRWKRVASLVLFVASFYTASLLVLYAVPILLGFWILRRAGRGDLPGVVGRYADFLLLPVGYWIVKALAFRSSGPYEGYNAISAAGLTDVPRRFVSVPWQVVGEPLARAIDVAGPIGIVAGVVAAAWLVWRGRGLGAATESVGAGGSAFQVPGVVLGIAGVAILALGVFPYLAVGRVPAIWDWSSRHQLLVPIGVAVIAAAVARGVGGLGAAGRRVGLVVVGLGLGISVVADVRTLLDYQLDWFKQEALVDAVRATPEAAAAHHVRIDDRATALNALRRTYRFYEYGALFEEAIGGTARLVANADGEPAPKSLPLVVERPRYRLTGYQPAPVDLTLQIVPRDRAGGLTALRLLALEATDSATYHAELARLIELRPAAAGAVP